MIQSTRLLAILPAFCFAFFVQKTPVQAQADSISTDHSYLRIKLENDFFSLGNWSDRYFSNGVRLEYQTPQSWHRLDGMRRIYPLLPGKTSKKLKLNFTFQMSMFTPEDLSRTDIIGGDRPYAGLIYLAASGVSNDFPTGTRLTTEYAVGLIGPAARQRQVQMAFHKLLIDWGSNSAVIPRGWGNQLGNMPALNVRTEYERILFSPVENMETIGGFEVNFGTITNYVALNANLRVGKLNDYFYNSSGLKMRDKTASREKMPPRRPFYPANINRKWQVYFFAKPSFRFALNNSLLQAGLFNRNSSPYFLPGDQLERFYVNVEFGYGVVCRKFGILYLQQFRSPEFVGAHPTTWGTVYFLIGFGGR